MKLNTARMMRNTSFGEKVKPSDAPSQILLKSIHGGGT